MGWKLFTGTFFWLLSLSCGSNQAPKLTIAAAANVQYACEELARSFSDKTGIPCHIIASSSGKLTAQILSGAPYDLLLSADLKYPRELFEQGKALAPPRVYASGQLLLWTAHNNLEPSLDRLTDPGIKRIALANPKTAPYGQAAMQTLSYYGLAETLRPKFVYGESIAQTTQFIHSGAAELGFTAKSVVLSPAIQSIGKWVEIDPAAYQAIEQGVVVIFRKRSTALEAAAGEFYDFLFSPTARQILLDYGYSLPPAK